MRLKVTSGRVESGAGRRGLFAARAFEMDVLTRFVMDALGFAHP